MTKLSADITALVSTYPETIDAVPYVGVLVLIESGKISSIKRKENLRFVITWHEVFISKLLFIWTVSWVSTLYSHENKLKCIYRQQKLFIVHLSRSDSDFHKQNCSRNSFTRLRRTPIELSSGFGGALRLERGKTKEEKWFEVQTRNI